MWEMIESAWPTLSVPIAVLWGYFQKLNKDHKKSRSKIWEKIEEEVKLRIAIEQKIAILEDREKNKHEIP